MIAFDSFSVDHWRIFTAIGRIVCSILEQSTRITACTLKSGTLVQ